MSIYTYMSSELATGSQDLHITWVKHPDYPGCERLGTMSKDEMISASCERPSDWDVYRDTATCEKLIFPSAITRILSHFSIPFPSSDHFSIICVIDAATVKRSEHMDARLDTLSTELYQVNVHVGRIARWQTVMGGFASEASPPPPPVASESRLRMMMMMMMMTMTMMLLMMMMEMLALLMRCLLDTLTLCHS
ncbi:hypothetical protein SO802_014072 [Lithocarpus litseifolius]|uniref:Uncharacterized protein n=1 Tax=Lithocarpus litseifolius TaxID=425828 RepID=A0AAW2DBJ0_9ROSI